MLGELFSYEIWAWVVTSIAMIYAVYLIFRSNESLVDGHESKTPGMVLAILSIVYIGLRPTHLYLDSMLYMQIFELVQTGQWRELPMVGSEWLWSGIELLFIRHSDCQMWYLLIAFVYVWGQVEACRKWFPNHFTTAIIFMLTAMSFWAYATNGIRNGMAVSVVLWGFALLGNSTPRKVVGFAVASLGIFIHTSVALTIIMAFACLWLPNYKTCLYIWVACFLISIPFSSTLVSALNFINFDERIAYYQNYDGSFADTTYRWDFVVYSVIPIVLGWYAIVRRGMRDAAYEFILSTYALTNAFWVIINTISYSNRFAYLSWFLYPFLLVWPLTGERFIKRQGVVAALALIAFASFNAMMIMSY